MKGNTGNDGQDGDAGGLPVGTPLSRSDQIDLGSLDFEPVDRATLYRLPGPPDDRAGG